MAVLLTLFRLGFFGRPWTERGGGAFDAPLPPPFLKNCKKIDMKLTPLIKRRAINQIC